MVLLFSTEAIKQLVSEYEAAGRVGKEALEKRHGKQLFQKVFDEMSTKWVKENGKPCPSCRSYIEVCCIYYISHSSWRICIAMYSQSYERSSFPCSFHV